MAVRGLGEVVLFVHDMERSLAFYRDLLGLSVMAQPDKRGAIFLELGKHADGMPHQIVLVPLPPDSAGFPSERDKRPLHHLGLELGAADFDSERDRLRAAGVEPRFGEHPFLPLRGMYLDDPDGNEVELIGPK